MRRILILALLGLATIQLVGCGGADKAPTKADPDAPKPPGDPKGGP